MAEESHKHFAYPELSFEKASFASVGFSVLN